MQAETRELDIAADHKDPSLKDIRVLAKNCKDQTFFQKICDIQESVEDKEVEDDLVREAIVAFYQGGYDRSELIDHELKAYMVNAKVHYDQLDNAAAQLSNGRANEFGGAPVFAQAASGSGASRQDVDAQAEVDRAMKAMNRIERSQEVQGSPVRLDLFGSLITSLSSIWSTKKKLAGAAASYLGEQARIEFGGGEVGTYRPLFGEGKEGKDFLRHDAALNRLELAGRDLEEGRNVDIDAIRRDVDYLAASMGSTKDSQPLSIEDMDRAKRTKDVIDEFTERAGKKVADDPQQKQRLEEIIKAAQNVGRMLSALIGRVAEKFKSMMSAGDEVKAETGQNTPARLRL